ncbi:CPBP family intramembrane metalloprotease [Roseateles sp. SL47]|uniref:CPBP family intramembrane glutamic endopeptidase n=1 Tax=Roseateles sp. SL47 TaxID=2995138 RepID=UPI00227046CD|nr:CPBP family intramembrane glutamic endopeptidase [Roseateles sp. SL47]WAC74484.1 CPBP family intramembrane metalloprotease [Roseateles sp. SL47]
MKPSAGAAKSTLSSIEAVVVSALCFGLFSLWSIQAVLAGFPAARYSNDAVIQMILLELVLAGVALLFLRLRGFDVKSLLPRPTWWDTLLGALTYLAAWLLETVCQSVYQAVVPPSPTPPVIEFSFTGLTVATLVGFAVVNGLFEEVFLLGVLTRGLRGLGLGLAIGLPMLLRLLYHTYQGPLGALGVVAFGLTVTLVYVRTGRLWPSVYAHILADVIPMAVWGVSQ